LTAAVAIGIAAPFEAEDELEPLDAVAEPPAREFVTLAACDEALARADDAAEAAEAPTEESDALIELAALASDPDTEETTDEPDAPAPEPLTTVKRVVLPIVLVMVELPEVMVVSTASVV